MDWNKIHSILFVPAQKKRLDKICSLNADAYIIDLEDAIKESDKDKSREEASMFLLNDLNKNILLRINYNEIDKEALWFSKLVSLKGVVIPKAEYKWQIETVKNAFPGKHLMALIETPLGMINLREILSSNCLSAIGFGAEDYCAYTGTAQRKEYLIPIQSRLVMYGAAFNVPVFDMVNAEYRKNDIYRDYVKTARNLGFSGKMAIHPNQIDIINQEYRLNNTEYLESIIREFEAGTSGFIIVDGKIYEKPHIEQIKKRLKNSYPI